MIKNPRSPAHWFGGLALTSMLVAPNIVAAQQPAVGNGDWYYQLGGASPISPSPNVNAVAITLLGSAELQLPRACGSLDPTIAISNLLGEVGDGVDQLDDLLVLAATEAIAALPAIVLQRANPGLYEHFQNSLSKAKQTFDLSVKSCEQYVEDFEQGNSPFSGWVRQSKSDTWKRRLAEEGPDSVDAQREADTLNGDDGVLWFGGERRAGRDQEALPVLEEATKAAYNLILGRDVTATGAPTVPDARLTELWPTAEIAGEFAKEVLGDRVIETCQGCTPGTVAPIGALTKIIERESEVIAERLVLLIESEGVPTVDELDEVSTPNMLVTADLIRNLRTFREAQEREIFVNRLAVEVALNRAAEQGLKLRRLLLTSLHIPEIVDNPLATDLIKGKVTELERTLDDLSFESILQDRLMSRTAGIAAQIANRSRLLAVDEVDRSNRVAQEDLILQGRVRPQ